MYLSIYLSIYVQAIRAGRTQSSSWRHFCDASEAGLEIARFSAMNGSIC